MSDNKIVSVGVPASISLFSLGAGWYFSRLAERLNDSACATIAQSVDNNISAYRSSSKDIARELMRTASLEAMNAGKKHFLSAVSKVGGKILGTLGVLSLIYAVYNYFKD